MTFISSFITIFILNNVYFLLKCRSGWCLQSYILLYFKIKLFLFNISECKTKYSCWMQLSVVLNFFISIGLHWLKWAQISNMHMYFLNISAKCFWFPVYIYSKVNVLNNYQNQGIKFGKSLDSMKIGTLINRMNIPLLC